jgi:hypothetical protein
MRFEISTVSGERFEMIGEPVELPNSCGETFVVHYNPFVKTGLLDDEGEVIWLDPVETEMFRVTHVGTGFRVAGGDSIDDAIALAAAKMKDKGEAEVRAVLERARATLAAA